jgi:hypothetical protein
MRRDWTARREQIANEMASIPAHRRPALIGAVAAKYGVCKMTVRVACKEFNVTIAKIPH